MKWVRSYAMHLSPHAFAPSLILRARAASLPLPSQSLRPRSPCYHLPSPSTVIPSVPFDNVRIIGKRHSLGTRGWGCVAGARTPMHRPASMSLPTHPSCFTSHLASYPDPHGTVSTVGILLSALPGVIASFKNRLRNGATEKDIAVALAAKAPFLPAAAFLPPFLPAADFAPYLRKQGWFRIWNWNTNSRYEFRTSDLASLAASCSLRGTN
jgi:hypothetical protein